MRQYLYILLSLLFFTQQLLAISISGISSSRKDVELIKTQLNLNNGAGELENVKKIMSLLSKEETPLELNYFQKLRAEINRKTVQEHEQSKKLGLVLNSTLKMPIDAFGFFIATGAVNFMSLWTHSEGNPLAFYQQVMSQKDPLTHISFYAFMLANGYTNEFFVDRFDKKHPNVSNELKASYIRRISYLALAAGSLASTLTSEVGTLIKECSNSWLNNANVSKEQSSQICDQAMSQWTLKNKSSQYLSQVMSMLIIQAATEITQYTTNAVVGTGGALTAKKLYELLKAYEYAYGFHLTGVDMVLYATPGKLAITSVKIAGKLSAFTLFVGLDHLMNSTITRGLNNIIKQVYFKAFDAGEINHILNMANTFSYDEYGISNCKSACGLGNDDPLNDFQMRMSEALNSYKIAMQGWRTHLNSDIEQDLASWLERTNRIIMQSKLTEEYYTDYLSNMLETKNAYYRINLPNNDVKKLTRETFNNKSEYPYRALPLFGIKFIPWTQDSDVTDLTAYYNFPTDTEREQSKYLKAFAEKLMNSKEFSYSGFNYFEAELVKNLLQSFLTQDPSLQGKELRKFLNYYNQRKKNGRSQNYQPRTYFNKFADYVFATIGKPNPQLLVGQGFNAAFEAKNQKDFEIADFDKWDTSWLINTNYKFNRPSDYLLYSLACGPDSPQIESGAVMNDEVRIWQPNFIPPNILNNNSPKELCARLGGSANSESLFTSKVYDVKTKKEYSNLTDYNSENIKMSFFADYKKDNSLDKSNFSKWWKDNSTELLQRYLKKEDSAYKKLITVLDQNILPSNYTSYSQLTKGYIDLLQFNINGQNLMSRNLLESFRYDKDFYLNIANLFLTKKRLPNNMWKKYDFLKNIKLKSMNLKYDQTLPVIEQRELIELNLSFESLLGYLTAQPLKIKYSEYSKSVENFHSKISELEALVGLKNKKASTLESSLFNNTDPNSSQNEITKYVYEPNKIDKLSLNQSAVKLVSEFFRELELEISRLVRLKVLMQQGLAFDDEDLKSLNKSTLEKACASSVRGCK